MSLFAKWPSKISKISFSGSIIAKRIWFSSFLNLSRPLYLWFSEYTFLIIAINFLQSGFGLLNTLSPFVKTNFMTLAMLVSGFSCLELKHKNTLSENLLDIFSSMAISTLFALSRSVFVNIQSSKKLIWSVFFLISISSITL